MATDTRRQVSGLYLGVIDENGYEFDRIELAASRPGDRPAIDHLLAAAELDEELVIAGLSAEEAAEWGHDGDAPSQNGQED
jgi:hypothetical protein